MAATPSGVSIDHIFDLLGRNGESAAMEMVDDGFLFKKGRIIKYRSDGWNFANIDDAILDQKVSLEHIDKSLIGTDGACLANFSAAIDKKYVGEFKKLVMQFAEDVSRFKGDPVKVGSGDDVAHFFCNLAYSVFDERSTK